MKQTRKNRGIVHWITRVSVLGIGVITAALVILIAAFNGIESMVERLYSDYDAPITIRSSKGKTFAHDSILMHTIKTTEGVDLTVKAVEEIVVLWHEKKRVNAKMLGVEESFLKMCQLNKHMVDGAPIIQQNDQACAVIGASLLDKLEGYISDLEGKEFLQIYTPLRESSIASMKSPFKVSEITVLGRMTFNREVNASEIIVPLWFAQEQLNYNQDISAYFVSSKKNQEIFELKERLQQKLGSNFIVKTAAEKNELVFKTSRSEKRIVIVILGFVFILAAFNLAASLVMLFVEKTDNIRTLQKIGATRKFIFKIFFFEGILIAFRGIIIGIILGGIICLGQYYFHWLEIPNSAGEAFPIKFGIKDGLLIFSLVSILSLLTAYLPVRYLTRKLD